MDEQLLRRLIPEAVGVLVRRGADVATAEDAVQEALLDALRTWPERPPEHRREEVVEDAPAPGPVPAHDETLQLYLLCAHPSLTPASAVALTLRAVGGLTTRQVAEAYLVPEATMAQRISRAKRTVAGVRLDAPGDAATVMRVLYLVFNEGYSGDVDLAAEAVRLTRRLHEALPHPEVAGLLALMLLHHARRPARPTAAGALVPLAEALHADAPSTEETDWVQVVEWYDELLALGENPVARLNRAVAVGEADGPAAGLAALAEVPDGVPRRTAASAYLHERAGDPARAAELYVEAAALATSAAERDHLTTRAARMRGLSPSPPEPPLRARPPRT